MARSRLTGRRHSRSSPAKGHCQLECWISEDAWNLLQAESARTGKSINCIVAECMEEFYELPEQHRGRLVNDLGADWLEDAETIEELDGVTQDRELSRLVNASLVYALQRGIE